MSAIFTPVYKGEHYQGHECSECKERVRFNQFSASGFLGTDIKYCPYCADDIIRFSNTPKFEEPLDTSVLEPIEKVIAHSKEKIKWIYWCCFNDEQRAKCKTIFEITNNYSNIRDIVFYKPHHTQLTKLKNKFSKTIKEE